MEQTVTKEKDVQIKSLSCVVVVREGNMARVEFHSVSSVFSPALNSVFPRSCPTFPTFPSSKEANIHPIDKSPISECR